MPLRTGPHRTRDGFSLRGYDSRLTPQLIAAADFVLVPSHWEPCGQIDMLGQLLGALPIVRAVDGLLKVRHRIDGFRYAPNQPDGLERTLKKALKLQERHPIWVRRMRRIAEKGIYERRS